MIPVELILRLQELEIDAWVEGGQLQLSSPRESLPADAREALATCEAELIEFLGEIDDQGDTPAIGPVPRDRPVPLSFAQERFWFLSQLEQDSAAYTILCPMRLRGPLDVDALTASLSAIVARHENLRTTVGEVDGRPVQVIAEPGDVDLPVIDLSDRDHRAQLERMIDEDGRAPFDLTTGPLFTCALYRVAPDEHVLLIRMHHLLGDRWSFGVLFEELSELYAARIAGREAVLPELPVQVADFAHWQRRWYEDDAGEHVAFWKQQLAGLPTLDLPMDHPRPPRQTFRGATQPIEISGEVSKRLEALSSEEGCTFFMTVLAAFNLLLARHTGSEDVVVGTPVGGRNRPEIEPLIGLFINSLVLRTDLSGEPSFRELMQRTRKVSLSAFEHEEMPFEQLVVELQPERDLSRNPLFQVLFNLLDKMSTPVFGDLEIELVQYEGVTSLVDLSLWLGHADGRVAGHFEYNTDLFDADTIARFVEHFKQLLAEIVRDPDRSIWELSILPAGELQLLLEDPNQTAFAYARDRCFHDLFAEQAARTPDAVAAVCDDEELTYAELDRFANQLAHHLRALGAGPDQLIGISVERSLPMLIGLLGIMKSGAAYVPLDPSYPNDRLAFILEDAGISLLVTQESLRSELPEELPQLVRLDADAAVIRECSTTAPESLGGADDLAYVIFTSGSTGVPKGVQIEHRSLVNFLTTMADRPGMTADDVLLAVTTISFDIAGLELYLPLLVGGRVVIARGGAESDGLRLAGLMASRGVTVMQATPATWRLLLEFGWSGDPQLKVLCGGEAFPRELVDQLLPRSGSVWNMYGPTETTIWSLVAELEPSTGPVPIGTPIGNTEIYLLDRHRQPVPLGVPGQLYLGGAGVARGYWNRPELTAEKFVSHPFRGDPTARIYDTGDLARYRADGTLEFLGRVDHQVKVRGFRIELGEIEHVLAGHEAVAECAVVVQTKRSGDAQLAAYAVLTPGGELSASAMRSYLREKLPDYMVPAAFDTLDAMPLTPNGKVDRKALAGDSARARGDEGYQPPATDTEKVVAEVWKELLEVDVVGRNDDFFSLGGHSLLAHRAVGQLSKREVSGATVRMILEFPVVADLAEKLGKTDAGARAPAIPVVPRDEPLPLSFAQERFYFLGQLEEEAAAYNSMTAAFLRGPLDVAALQWSLEEIVRRHEILRTSIEEVDGRPMQVILEPGAFELPVVDLTSHADPRAEALRLVDEDTATPFDLEAGPPVSWKLLHTAPDEYLLVLKVYHTVWDQWSFGVVCEELSELYEARTTGRDPVLSELSVQYADFACWQREWYEHDSAETLAYWKEKLDGLPTIDLPVDRPRPPMQSFAGAVAGFDVDQRVAAQLDELARDESCTFFMTYLAAFYVLLARYTGQEDLVIGTPAGRRDQAEFAPLIGQFLNTLVLRADLSGDPTFRDLLGRVREVALWAYEHQDMPFGQLVTELRPERDFSRNPLYQVLFNLLDKGTTPTLGDVEIEFPQRDVVNSLLDLSLWMGHTPRGIGGHFEYNTDLFDADTIARFVEHFKLLLAEIAANPDRSIWDLAILPAGELQLLLEDPNRTARDYPRDRCFHELFAEQAARTPEAIAAECGDDHLTYAELDGAANQLAQHLRGLGAGPDQLIGISVERSLWMLIGLLGIMKSGAAYVPLDPSYPVDRLAFILEDAGIELLVTQEGLREQLPERLPQLVQLDADAETIGQCSPEAPEPLGGADSLAYVIFTSGSTGVPKGVQIEHRALVNFLATMADRPGMSADDVLLAVTTISFDIAGLELYLPLLVGGRVVIAAGGVESDGPGLLALLGSSGATVMQATPATWKLLVESGWERTPGLRVLCGGEAMPRELAEQLLARCGELWNMYGPTETTIWSLINRVESGTGQVPIGDPIANTEIYVLDRHRQPVPIGVSGELYLGGDGLARGYWNRPELTAEKFVAHPFARDREARLYNTGDLARYRADGTLEFLGRVDHQVKVRGFRIELGEIEHVLARHPVVGECAVVVQRKRSGDAQLVAHLVFEAGGMATAAELQAALRTALPDYMVPSTFVVRDDLPLTPNGKIDRKALTETAATRLASSESQLPPRTESEKKIAAIWSEILEVEQVGRNDNFFDLGGHSLLILQLRRRLRERLDVDLSIAEVFQYPTVGAMASFVSEGDEAPAFETLQDRVRRRRSGDGRGAIAIVGMAGRFPGARNLDDLWQNLRDGVESVTHLTDEELRASGVPDDLLSQPNYIKMRAILDDVEMFDAGFFGIPAREAQTLDPQHRFLLECSYQALEDAGYDPLHCPGAVSVFAGSLPNTYVQNNINTNPDFLATADAFQVFLNNYGGGFLATRISYKLNLKGTSVEVQTACSTSLVAVAQACEALLNDQCDMALAGGVAITVPQRLGYLYQEGLILSPDGRCRPFDAKAQGTLGGEGVGMVVLKRLDDALAAGDHIRAVIRGAATNNDGSNKVGFTAPSVEGQSEVIFSALAEADVDPVTIGYVEAHGTATPLGDPIEIAALTRAYRAQTDKAQFCAIGSIKSNFGHTDAAAGVAGLIKTVLALEHGEIPPSLHFEQPNPEIDFRTSPFFVNTELRAWQPEVGPRRAGVSSFGLGGTNAHVVLEEAPALRAAETSRARHVLTVSARTPEALEAAAAQLAAYLEEHHGVSLADVAFTTQQSRSGLPHRRAVTCSDVESAVLALRGGAPDHTASGVSEADDPRVVFLFPGQGAQHVDMGRELYDSEPVFRAVIDRCAELLRPHLDLDLRGLLYPNPAAAESAAADLQQTRLTQPAVFVIEYALAKLWMAWGVQPDAMLGHSVGEFVAATLAGVFTLEDALRLVAARGRMMQALPAGDMLSVPLPRDQVDALLGADLSLAAVNSPGTCVVSGPAEAVQLLRDQLAEQALPARVLHTSHAFHSAMMDPMVEPFAALVRETPRAPAAVPCVSTVTGTWIDPADWVDPGYWAQNLRQPVRFSDGAQTLLADTDRVLLEVGPGQTLGALIKQHGAPARGRAVVSSMRHPQQRESDLGCALAALGRLWIAGVAPDWSAFHAGHGRQRVSLPTYPFERQRYWVEPTTRVAARTPTLAKKPDVGDWFYVPSWRASAATRFPALAAMGQSAPAWLVFLDEGGLGAALVRRLRTDGQTVIQVRAGTGLRRVGETEYEIDPHRRDGYAALLAELRALGRERSIVLHLWSVTADARSRTGVEALQESETLGFSSLLFVAQAAGSEPLQIELVTNSLRAAGGTTVVRPERATAFGACTVIPQEYPLITARSIDIELPEPDSRDEADLVERILAEALTDPGDPVIALRGRHRWVQSFDATSLPEVAGDCEVPLLRAGGVYLITGGLGGIGLAFAERLADRGAKLALVGRSGLPPRDECDAWIAEHGEEDRTSRRIRAVRELEKRGAEVLVVRADVSSREEIGGALRLARERFGRLHGVVHAAGVMEQQLIENLTPESAARTIAPKLNGTVVLADALEKDDLDFFLMCSSISTTLGGLGLADYAGANAFLDAFAHSHDRSSGPAFVSADWDGWADVGFVADAREQLSAEERGPLDEHVRDLIRATEGQDALLRLLANPFPQVIVCPQDFDLRVRRSRAWRDDDENAAAEVAGAAVSQHARPALATDYVAPQNELEQRLAEIVEELVGIERVGVHDSLFDLGFDSLLAHRMIGRVQDRLDIGIPLRAVLESPTVAGIAKYVQALRWAAGAG